MSGSYSSDRLRGARPVGSPRLPAVASTLCDTEFLGGLYVSVGCTDSRWVFLFRDTEFLGVKVCVAVKQRDIYRYFRQRHRVFVQKVCVGVMWGAGHVECK